MEDNSNIIRDALNAGRALGQAQTIEGIPVIVAPEDYKVHVLDLEQHQSIPKRCSGTVKLQTVDSFLRFIDRHNNPGKTVVFSSLDDGEFTAIFNYRGNDLAPGWGDDKAILTLTESRTWKMWVTFNDRRMSQLEFADFIEANASDIISPPAAEIMEMVSALKVHRKSTFHSVIDNRTGRQTLEYSEETKGETSKGNLEFAGQFELGLRPYMNRDTDKAPYKVNARLRFRVDDNGSSKSNLKIYYSLVNEDVVKEHAFYSELARIEEHLKNLEIPMFDGSPG